MTYQQQAERINEHLKFFFKGISGSTALKDELINAILKFGQVAKFRCRSNVAYDNFSKLCFKDIAELERRKPSEDSYEELMVKK